MICGSCFRSQGSRNRLKALCELYLAGKLAEEPGRTCSKCGLPLLLKAEWDETQLLHSMRAVCISILEGRK